jgi:hypothetical protein
MLFSGCAVNTCNIIDFLTFALIYCFCTIFAHFKERVQSVAARLIECKFDPKEFTYVAFETRRLFISED